MKLELLYTELQDPKFDELDSEQAAAELNNPVVEQRHLVDKVPTLNYLMGQTDVWDKLLEALEDDRYPPELKRKIRKFQTTVTTYEKTDYANYEADTGILVDLNILTQEEVDGFMALSLGYISRAQQLVDEPVTITQIRAARAYPQYLQLQSERDALAQQVAIKDAQIADILAGNIEEEDG